MMMVMVVIPSAMMMRVTDDDRHLSHLRRREEDSCGWQMMLAGPRTDPLPANFKHFCDVLCEPERRGKTRRFNSKQIDQSRYAVNIRPADLKVE
jgi:hypothetical protein